MPKFLVVLFKIFLQLRNVLSPENIPNSTSNFMFKPFSSETTLEFFNIVAFSLNFSFSTANLSSQFLRVVFKNYLGFASLPLSLRTFSCPSIWLNLIIFLLMENQIQPFSFVPVQYGDENFPSDLANKASFSTFVCWKDVPV